MYIYDSSISPPPHFWSFHALSIITLCLILVLQFHRIYTIINNFIYGVSLSYLHTHTKSNSGTYDTSSSPSAIRRRWTSLAHIFFINLKHNQYVTPFCVFTHNEKGIEMKLRWTRFNLSTKPILGRNIKCRHATKQRCALVRSEYR